MELEGYEQSPQCPEQIQLHAYVTDDSEYKEHHHEGMMALIKANQVEDSSTTKKQSVRYPRPPCFMFHAAKDNPLAAEK